MKRVAAIIQARTGSTRLPGKVMLNVSGKALLWHVLNRVKQAGNVDDIVVATTTLSEDEQILELASEMDVKSYAGSENDVLDRYYQAALKYKADVIVRITADCPLIEPEVLDRMAAFFLGHDIDYVSNTIKPTYPDGLDVEVFSLDALKRAWEEATLVSEREHVTSYIKKNPHLFKVENFEHSEDLSKMRWTVDEERDLAFVREVYRRLYVEGDKIFIMKDVLDLLEQHPGLTDLNKNIIRDEGYLKSLSEDKVIEQRS